MKFYMCKTCKNLIMTMEDPKGVLTCCGNGMEELLPNTSDGAGEKHVPVVALEGNRVTVQVGEVEHPMMEAHYINWICVETEKGAYTKWLEPGEAPKAEFLLPEDEKVVRVYEYCNLHGLWMKEC